MASVVSLLYNTAGDNALVVVCFLQQVTMPWLLSVSFVTAGDNAWSIAHTVFHTSQQVITHGLSSVSYVAAANNCMVYRLFHTSQQLLRMVYRLFHTSQQLISMVYRLFHTPQKVIMHGLSPTLVIYVMQHNRGYLVGLRSFSCNLPKGIGWNKATGLSLTRAYCRLMLRNLYLLRGL